MPIRPLIFGEVLFDRFEDGACVLGGAPFNVAWHLQAFGLAPLMVSRVGDDGLGRQVLQAMRDWGMDSTGMQLDRQHGTGIVDITLVQGEPRYHIAEQQAYDFISAAELPPLAGEWMLYHGSLATRSAASATTLQALRNQLPDRVFVDINLRAPWWQHNDVLQLLAGARWLKLNADELQTLLPQEADDRTRIALLPGDAREYLVLTHGEHGAVAYRMGEQHCVRPGQQVAIVDAVGAGDAFCSVLMLGLVRQWPLALALERAQQFASAVVGIRGAIPRDMNFYQPYNAAWA